MAFSTKMKGPPYLQGNVQVFNVRIPVSVFLFPGRLPFSSGKSIKARSAVLVPLTTLVFPAVAMGSFVWAPVEGPQKGNWTLKCLPAATSPQEETKCIIIMIT